MSCKDNCIICFEKINSNSNKCTLLSCHQCFHDDCLRKWFKTNSSCPMCRKEVNIPVDNFDYNGNYRNQITFGALNGFQITVNKYLIPSCIVNNHTIKIEKPYGVITRCMNCNNVKCFGYKG